MSHAPIEAPPAEPPGTRRERRKAETRARVLAAARVLFVERGFDATRPQDIAAAADVGVGTVYLHFQDKRGVFLAFTEQAAGELMDRVRERVRAARDFGERLRASLGAVLSYADENPGVLGAAFTDAAVIAAGLPRGVRLRDRLAESIAQGLRNGMSSGELRADLDPDVIANGMVGFVHHALAQGAERGADRTRLVEDVSTFLEAGMRAEGLGTPRRKNG